MKAIVFISILFFSTLAIANNCNKHPTFEDISKWKDFTVELSETTCIRFMANPDNCAKAKSARLYVDYNSEAPNKIPLYWYQFDGRDFVFFWDSKDMKYKPVFNYREFWWTDKKR